MKTTKCSLKLVTEDGIPLTLEERLSILSTMYTTDEILKELTKRGYSGELKNQTDPGKLTLFF